MRSKTRQRLIREEYEYEMNRPSYDDVERDMNNDLYGYPLTNKELIKYIHEELLLINYNDNVYDYTESNIQLNEFTYTKEDIHIDENGKNIFTQMKMVK